MLVTEGRGSRRQLARQKLIALQMMTLSGVVRPAEVELHRFACPSRLLTPSSDFVNPATLKLTNISEQDRIRLNRRSSAKALPKKACFRANPLSQLQRILSGFQWETERT